MKTTTTSALRITAASAAVVAAWATVAAMPAEAVAPAPSSTSSASPAGATSISIRAVHGHTHAGAKDAITGDLHVAGADAEGRQVTLESRTQGEDGFTPVGVATAGEHGGLRLAVAPEVTTRYRWSYAGADDARARTSGVVTVKVSDTQHRTNRLPTSLSVRAAHRAVDARGADTVHGQLRSRSTGLPHRTVVLLSRVDGGSGWRFAATRRTGEKGLVSFVVHPRTSTHYRLDFQGTTVFRPARSGVVAVGVRPRVTISAEPASVDPGGSTVLSGVATRRGTALAGASVDLLAKAAGTHAHFAQVATGTTADDGAVAFTQTPTRDTTYRLRLEASPGTAGTPSSLSRPLTVNERYASSLSVRGTHVADGYAVGGTLRGHGHAVSGAPVTLQSQAPGTTTWTAVDEARTGRIGGVRFSEPETPGTGYRLVFAGGNRFAASTSGTVVD